MGDAISVLGLLTGPPDDWTPKRADLPIRVQVELGCAQEQTVELGLSVVDLTGQELVRQATDLSVPAGRCWIEAWLPAGALASGRYSLAAQVTGHDLFRSRHLLEVWPGAGAGPGAAPAGWRVHCSAMARPPSLRHVLQLRLRRPDGGEPLAFRGDEPVEAVARLDLGDLERPLLRFQVFSRAGELLLGTNTNRWGADLGCGGEVTVRVAYDRLNLVPGCYLATVGLWPDEAAPVPVEARHGYHEILVE
jgi:hypothetical protein